MPTLAAYPGMMQRARKREGLRVCRAAWLVGISVREYREIEAGDRTPSLRTYERIFELYGWPQTFVGEPRSAVDLYPQSPPDAGSPRIALAASGA
jgi:transcriptional regulator with XRE-family HTH domain